MLPECKYLVIFSLEYYKRVSKNGHRGSKYLAGVDRYGPECVNDTFD